jgi:hypothetical protein
MLYAACTWMVGYCEKYTYRLKNTETLLDISMDEGQGEVSEGPCLSVYHERHVGQNSQ